MKEVNIPLVLSPDSESSQDIERAEEKYTERNEQYLLAVKEECLHLCNEHDIAAHRFRKAHNCYSVPVICLPVVMGCISPLLPPEMNFVNSVSLSVVGVMNGLLTFRNYSKKHQQHAEFAGKYSDLAHEIGTEMSRSRRFRQAYDTFLYHISTKYQNLNLSAPMI